MHAAHESSFVFLSSKTKTDLNGAILLEAILLHRKPHPLKVPPLLCTLIAAYRQETASYTGQKAGPCAVSFVDYMPEAVIRLALISRGDSVENSCAAVEPDGEKEFHTSSGIGREAAGR